MDYSSTSSTSSSPSFEPSALRNVLASALATLEQTPPPSLRDIVGAYRSRPAGEEDRELLLAMLSAKSAEDQRLASQMALHRKVLEVWNASDKMPESRTARPTVYDEDSDYERTSAQRSYHPPSGYSRRTRRVSQSSSSDTYPRERMLSKSPERLHRCVKRQKRSASPDFYSELRRDYPPAPPSPESQTHSDDDNFGQSSRSRQTMRINSLLSPERMLPKSEEDVG